MSVLLTSQWLTFFRAGTVLVICIGQVFDRVPVRTGRNQHNFSGCQRTYPADISITFHGRTNDAPTRVALVFRYDMIKTTT
jgi:hypothetical protein